MTKRTALTLILVLTMVLLFAIPALAAGGTQSPQNSPSGSGTGHFQKWVYWT